MTHQSNAWALAWLDNKMNGVDDNEMTCSWKWVDPEMTCSWNDMFMKWHVHEMTCSWNDMFIKMIFWWNTILMKWHFN
jgi:hypothetical protein